MTFLSKNIETERPHVVILGSGASVAAFPNGDRNGKKLPVMDNFIEVLELGDFFRDINMQSTNIEEVYSNLFESNLYENKLSKLNKIIYDYFDSLEPPEGPKPNKYDYLILSLTGNDLIATFNWDPLLVHSYLVNFDRGFTLPDLAFLHGNVAMGSCDEHNIQTVKTSHCTKCNQNVKPTQLLYPIKNKNYSADKRISSEWFKLRNRLKKAHYLTVFGYGGPKSDEEAKVLLNSALKNSELKQSMKFEIITKPNYDKQEILTNWKDFLKEDQYEIHDDFFKSWIATYPRQSFKAFISQINGVALDGYKSEIPKDLPIGYLWKWIQEIDRKKLDN